MFVRKTPIDITQESITKHLGVNEYKGDHVAELKKLFPTDRDLAKAIIKYLCHTKSVTWTKKGDEFVHISANHLSPIYRAWHKFICIRLMPTSYTFNVNFERALVLLAIHLDMSINVAQIYHEQLIRCVSHFRAQSWYFPKFITTLCRYHGVKAGADEGVLQETKKITMASLARPPPPAPGVVIRETPPRASKKNYH